MGDEKRHVDHLEEAARKAEADLRDDLEKAVEFEKADVAETHREWHDQLHNDMPSWWPTLLATKKRSARL